MTLNDFSIWTGILVGWISGGWALFLHFRKKCRLKIDVFVRQFDHSKGLNACIHPVNELVVSIVNTSDLPLTIRSLEFVYCTKGDQAQLSYDNIIYKKKSSVEKRTLQKSEEVSFSLSYNSSHEKSVIDQLENIILISSYDHKYPFGCKELRAVIKQVQALPPPHPDNLVLDFESGR